MLLFVLYGVKQQQQKLHDPMIPGFVVISISSTLALPQDHSMKAKHSLLHNVITSVRIYSQRVQCDLKRGHIPTSFLFLKFCITAYVTSSLLPKTISTPTLFPIAYNYKIIRVRELLMLERCYISVSAIRGLEDPLSRYSQSSPL